MYRAVIRVRMSNFHYCAETRLTTYRGSIACLWGATPKGRPLKQMARMIWNLITKFRCMKLRMWDGRCHHQWFSRKKWGLDGGLQHWWDWEMRQREELTGWFWQPGAPGLGSALQGGQRPIWHFSRPGGHWTKPDLWPDSHAGLNLLTGRSDTWQGGVKGQIQWDFSLVSNQFQQLTASVCFLSDNVKYFHS